MERILIVARFHEDLDWLTSVRERLPETEIVIYDKSPAPLPGALPLPNIGRESHTYFTHIARNFPRLSPSAVYVFTQGHPFDHCGDFVERLAHLQPGFQPFGNEALIDRHDGEPHHHLLQQWLLYELVFRKKSPPFYRYFPGSIFAVSGELLLARPAAFWAGLLELSTTLPNFGYMIERMWDKIFLEPLDPDCADLTDRAPTVRRLMAEGKIRILG